MADNTKKKWEDAADVTGRADAEAALSGLSYQKSDAVLAAEQALAEHTAKQPAAYESTYQGKIDTLVDQIINREDFSYSFDADPLYQQYKDKYTRAGQLAMMDTAANASAATGGYGSSYAVSAASQAYQNQLAGLNDAMPALYEAAQERYSAAGDAMHDDLAGLTTLEKNAYSAYSSGVDDYYKGLAQYADRADAAYNKDYKAYQDVMAGLQDVRDYYAGQEQQGIANAREEAAYQLALQKYAESVRQWEAEQAAARNKWQTQLAEDQRQFNADMAYQQAKLANTLKTGTSSVSQASGKTGSTAALSAAAEAVQKTLRQELAQMRAATGVNVASAAELTASAKNILKGYAADGTITKAEANRIGQSYGVSL